MLSRKLRFSDLVALGIFNNRTTCSNWIKAGIFPPGELIGPNTRVWDEGEVEAALAKRPTAPKETPQPNKGKRGPGRPRKNPETVAPVEG